MAKDRKARQESRVTVIALANMLAALVDAAREVDVPNDIIHRFLDKLEQMNRITLAGTAAELLCEFVDVVRGTVPVND